jgi:hypothetical protein
VPDVFTDGIYTFDVTYTDATTDISTAQLGGVFPPFPANLQLNDNLISWDQWQNPTPTSFIEIEIGTDGDGIGADLASTATSFVVPEGLEITDIELSFRNREFPDGYKSSSSTLTPGPECDIQLDQAAYIDGDTVTADVFRVANTTGVPIAVELKVWQGLPDMPPISFFNIGSDGSTVLPAGADIDRGPWPLLTVTSDLPRGSHEISCRILDPVTGELLWEDLNNFEILATNSYAIGDTGPAGGIVFYISDGGLHGFEAAPEDLANAEWGCVGTVLPGADGTDIGTGAQNTADILAGCSEPDIAARLVDDYMLNGFSDWFLPSKDELNEIYLNRAVVDGLCMQGTCAVYFYWGSTEENSSLSWGQRIGDDGFQNIVGKNASFAVRPIRAF